MAEDHGNLARLLKQIREIHEEVRQTVVAACERSSSSEMAQVAADGEGDTIYAIDRISEDLLVYLFEEKVASQVPIVLIAEGISGGKMILPRGASENDAAWRIIVDPIDGTRCLMYQKRSGWVLTGVAPNLGEATTLADIQLAVQTELPLVKQHLSDALWAVKGSGTRGERFNRITGERTAFIPNPSTATGLAHGFAAVARFFSGGRDILAAIDDEILLGTLGTASPGKAYCFEDQYLSTGGQLYELMMGHDRFLADLRPLLRPVLLQRGWPQVLCCHPYDLCTELLAREAGIIVHNETGAQLTPSLDIHTNVAWAAYANTHIQKLVQPLLLSAIVRFGLIDQDPARLVDGSEAESSLICAPCPGTHSRI